MSQLISEGQSYIAIDPIPDLVRGWGIGPFAFKPHFWIKEDENVFSSACKMHFAFPTVISPMTQPGNFPKCEFCEAALRKKPELVDKQ